MLTQIFLFLWKFLIIRLFLFSQEPLASQYLFFSLLDINSHPSRYYLGILVPPKVYMLLTFLFFFFFFFFFFLVNFCLNLCSLFLFFYIAQPIIHGLGFFIKKILIFYVILKKFYNKNNF